jgi:hypothetical protein
MAAAAVIGIALSAVGVWLVKTTFDETRKANEIASKSIRPWIIVESFNLKRLLVHNIINKDGTFALLEAEIGVRNIGKAPAYGFRRHGGPVTDVDEADKTTYQVNFVGDCLAPNQHKTVSIFGTTEIYNWSGEADEVGLFKPVDCMISFTYASQKDSDPHETRQFWRIGSRVDKNLVMWSATDVDEGKIQAELAFTTRLS